MSDKRYVWIVKALTWEKIIHNGQQFFSVKRTAIQLLLHLLLICTSCLQTLIIYNIVISVVLTWYVNILVIINTYFDSSQPLIKSYNQS